MRLVSFVVFAVLAIACQAGIEILDYNPVANSASGLSKLKGRVPLLLKCPERISRALLFAKA